MGYGDELAQQVGSQAAGGVIGAGMDILLQPWRNSQQLKQNKALMEQQMEAQMKMGKYNQAMQMEMWNKTNYEAQVEHLKNAGLNPALLYAKGGAGGSTAANAGNVSTGTADSKAGGGYSGMDIMTPAQVRLMEAQARNLDADTQMKTGVETENVAAKTTLTHAEARIKALDADIKKETLYDQINMIVSQTIEQQEKGLMAGQQREVGENTIQDQIKIIKQTAINKIIEAEVMQQGIQLSKAQIDKMAADIANTGRGLDIQQFTAEVTANQPEMGKVIGGMLNRLQAQIDKIMGLGKDKTLPKQVGK